MLFLFDSRNALLKNHLQNRYFGLYINLQHVYKHSPDINHYRDGV